MEQLTIEEKQKILTIIQWYICDNYSELELNPENYKEQKMLENCYNKLAKSINKNICEIKFI